MPGFIRADYALGDARPGCQLHLRQPSTPSGLAEQAAGGQFWTHARIIADRRWKRSIDWSDCARRFDGHVRVLGRTPYAAAHLPSALAASTSARPDGRIRP